jgi:chemotaxis protein CheX
VNQLVETIWTSVLDWEVQPSTDVAAPGDDSDLIGSVPITGAWTGSVLLRCHRDVTTGAAVRMFGMAADQLPDDLVRDALGELTNILAGNLKGLLSGSCRLGLPTVVRGDDLPLPAPGCRQMLRTAFRCDTRLMFVEILERYRHG